MFLSKTEDCAEVFVFLCIVFLSAPKLKETRVEIVFVYSVIYSFGFIYLCVCIYLYVFIYIFICYLCFLFIYLSFYLFI